MATTQASKTDAFSSVTYYDLIMNFIHIARNFPGNYSDFEWEVYIRANGGTQGYFWNDPRGSKSIKINNATVSSGAVPAMNFAGTKPQTRKVASGTRRINHDADGTLEKVPFYAYVNLSGLLGNAAVSGNLTVPRIPRGPRVRVGGVWRNTVAYVRVNGQWKIAIPYVRVSGSWKIAGG